VSGIAVLRAELLAGRVTPEQTVMSAYERLAALDDAVVISLVAPEDALARARTLTDVDPSQHALWGVPFAVKDNIDVAGVPTTAGCPAFASTPAVSATVVRRLEAAGAIPVAKTNLDQFATGLVGTRSPYGTPRNPWDPTRVPGGSSSGSAVAVACGAVPFALGTDTAGSGRVPAAFTGIVGAKPTRGWLSTSGVVPAVRTVDCVSALALSVTDVWAVLEAAAGFDAADPFSRKASERGPSTGRVGVAAGIDPGFDLGMLGPVAEVDMAPFLEAGRLLYGGPWVAERYAVLGDWIEAHPGRVDPTVGAIITGAAHWSAADAARAGYQLASLRRQVEQIWDDVDVIVLPTAPPAPTLADVAADPIGVNAALGTYTTFVNLLDLCAFAVPAGFHDGMPVGVQVLAPAWGDATAAGWADHIHAAAGGLQGVTGAVRDGPPWAPPELGSTVEVAVVGAHLRGQPLHHQLTDLGARWVADARTAPAYRLYALGGTTPPKPGLLRTAPGAGASIEVEVYRMTLEAFGRFVATVRPPLCIGTVVLETAPVAGFLCEPAALAEATDITAYGGWRAYLAATAQG
jgi:allophanate hydrolase